MRYYNFHMQYLLTEVVHRIRCAWSLSIILNFVCQIKYDKKHPIVLRFTIYRKLGWCVKNGASKKLKCLLIGIFINLLFMQLIKPEVKKSEWLCWIIGQRVNEGCQLVNTEYEWYLLTEMEEFKFKVPVIRHFPTFNQY